MLEDLVVRPLPSMDTAGFEDEPECRHFLCRRLGRDKHGLLELVKGLLQPGVSLAAMDLPVRVGPLADPRVVPLSHADALVSGCCIFNLLIVDGPIFDHGFDQSVAQAGTIGSA